MEQPRGQQPALLPDQLPDGGRRARLHRGVSARPRCGRQGRGCCRGGPAPRAGATGKSPAGPGRDVRVQGRGSCLFPSSFLLFPSFPLTLLHSPFPIPPLLKPLVSFKNVEAWFTAVVAAGFVMCWWGVTGLRTPCVLSLFPTGCSSSPVPEAEAADTAPGRRQRCLGCGMSLLAEIGAASCAAICASF